MKIPRDVDADDLVKALRIRISTELNGEHHVTIPRQGPLKIGTLVKGVLKPVAAHHKLTMEELLQKLRL